MAGLGDLTFPQQPGQAFTDPMSQMGFMERMQYMRQNNPQALMSLAAGLMKGDVGAGFASAGDAMAQHRQDLMKQQTQQMELGEQRQKENMTKRWLMSNKGMSDEEATMAMSNPAILGTYLKADEQYADTRPASVQEFEYGQKNPAYLEWAKSNKGRDSTLTTPDKKAIFEAEDELPQIDNTIAVLNRALELNPKTAEGFGATSTGQYGTWLPDSFEPATAAPTREYQDLMSMEAVKSMSDTLKGASTDYEMRQFIEIIGDVNKPKDIRERALKRMLEVAKRKKGVAEKRVNQLRSGDYYSPSQGGGSGEVRDLGNGVTIKRIGD